MQWLQDLLSVLLNKKNQFIVWYLSFKSCMFIHICHFINCVTSTTYDIVWWLLKRLEVLSDGLFLFTTVLEVNCAQEIVCVKKRIEKNNLYKVKATCTGTCQKDMIKEMTPKSMKN